MKTFTIQQSFDFLLSNQDRLGDKISLLADLWGASRLIVSGIKKEVSTTSRKVVKTVKAVKTRRRCKVAKKVARSSTIIYEVPNLIIPSTMDRLLAFGDRLCREIGLGTSLSLINVETFARLSLLKGGSKELKTLLTIAGQIVRMTSR